MEKKERLFPEAMDMEGPVGIEDTHRGMVEMTKRKELKVRDRVRVGYGPLEGREATVTRTDILAENACNIRTDNGETDTIHKYWLRKLPDRKEG